MNLGVNFVRNFAPSLGIKEFDTFVSVLYAVLFGNAVSLLVYVLFGFLKRIIATVLVTLVVIGILWVSLPIFKTSVVPLVTPWIFELLRANGINGTWVTG
jgi:hypothetical protein